MEDEDLVSSIAMQMLDFIGYKSVLSLDGKEAITLYCQHLEAGNPFTAVIMDLTIPGGMGGEEAVRELLKIDPSAKVIVSSGYSNDPAMVKFKDFGFCASISKPFNIQDLKTVLESLDQ